MDTPVERRRRVPTPRVRPDICIFTADITLTRYSRDGSVSSLLILYAGGAVFFATTTYFALDQAFGITSLFLLSRSSAAERDLGNVALMLLGVLWPYL